MKTIVRSTLIVLTVLLSAVAYGHEGHHGIPNMGDHPVDWHTDQIIRTMTFSGDGEVARVVTLDGRKCLEGKTFGFAVDDQYAFDIDERIEVAVEFYQHRETAHPQLAYERN